MKCPNCGDRTAVELDTHSSGFSSEELPLKECGACGLVWRVKYVGAPRRCPGRLLPDRKHIDRWCISISA